VVYDGLASRAFDDLTIDIDFRIHFEIGEQLIRMALCYSVGLAFGGLCLYPLQTEAVPESECDGERSEMVPIES
jgi:hypothetical protein